MIQPKTVVRQVRVILTDQEKLTIGSDIGRALQAHASAREQAKEVAAQAKAEAERHRLEVERLGGLLANGYEYQDVECRVEVDVDDRRLTVTRLDTGEVIEDRRARPEELQGELAL